MYLFIALVEAVMVGALAWGTGWIIWNRVRRLLGHRPESK